MRGARLMLCLLSMLSLPGCLAAALVVGGAGTYGAVEYSDNESSRDFPATLDDTWKAAVSAMRDVGHPVADDIEHGPTDVFRVEQQSREGLHGGSSCARGISFS